MGYLAKLNRGRKKELAKARAYQLSKELQRFYSTHTFSTWQQERVKEIRALYEARLKDLEVAHDHAASRCSEEFMQFELDYALASDAFKEKNPGMEWTPSGVKGLFAKAFWKNLMTRAKKFGVNLNAKEEPAK